MGISEDVGNSLCYIIYNKSEGTIVHCSEVRSALDDKLRNLREDPITVDSGPHSKVQYVPSIPSAPGEQAPPFVCDANSYGEKTRQYQSSDIFEKFMIPLFDKNGEPRLDDKGKLLQVLVLHLNDLQGRTFLTNPDQGGQVQ